jgi:hypothetical protein
MAWDAETATRLMPVANKNAASIFMGFPFCWYVKKTPDRIRSDCVTNDDGANGGGANGDANAHDGASALVPA